MMELCIATAGLRSRWFTRVPDDLNDLNGLNCLNEQRSLPSDLEV
jgi:hypothetical protein